MDLTLKLNESYADTTADLHSDAYWKPALRAAALEVQALNVAMAELLPEPIPCNPDSEIMEGYLGDSCTIPTSYGYVNVRLMGFRKLIPPPGVSPQTFSFVLGEPIEDGSGGEFYAAGRFA